MELFERAVTFVKFFSFLFSSGLSVFVHLMVSYLYVFMNFSFIHRGGSRGRVQGVRTPLPPEMTCGFLIQLVFCKKKKSGLLVLK